MNIFQGWKPHLGGEARDIITYVTTLKMNHGEKLVEYYTRAKEMEFDIIIQKNEAR